MDIRAVKLGLFFEHYKCPKPYYIDEYIKYADQYKIDYRILPAISVKESSCLKRYPRNTNNPFGYGGERGLYKFSSIPSAIDYVTGQLANGKYYVGKTLEKKLSTYCPEPSYVGSVKKIISQIE